jgi:hypothetical protein
MDSRQRRFAGIAGAKPIQHPNHTKRREYMKLNLVTTAALLATAGALMTQPAKAQFVGLSGDLILSFSDSVGADTGSGTNYEIDLGQVSLYKNATSTINITNIDTDLKSVYGNGFFSNGNLTFQLSGEQVTSGTVEQVYLSTPSTTPFAGTGTTNLSGTESAAASLYTPALDTSANAPVVGSTVGSYKVPTANLYSWSSQSAPILTSYAPSTTFGQAGGVDPTLKLDIFQTTSHSAGTSSLLSGVFDISSSGEVSYDLIAAPEPSSYAMMLIGGVVLMGLIRRKSSSRI